MYPVRDRWWYDAFSGYLIISRTGGISQNTIRFHHRDRAHFLLGHIFKYDGSLGHLFPNQEMFRKQWLTLANRHRLLYYLCNVFQKEEVYTMTVPPSNPCNKIGVSTLSPVFTNDKVMIRCRVRRKILKMVLYTFSLVNVTRQVHLSHGVTLELKGALGMISVFTLDGDVVHDVGYNKKYRFIIFRRGSNYRAEYINIKTPMNTRPVGLPCWSYKYQAFLQWYQRSSKAHVMLYMMFLLHGYRIICKPRTPLIPSTGSVRPIRLAFDLKLDRRYVNYYSRLNAMLHISPNGNIQYFLDTKKKQLLKFIYAFSPAVELK
jgi:hypothetical protein